jgi:L-cystine transport system permease protein
MENLKLIIGFLVQLLPAIKITLIVSLSSIILGSFIGLWLVVMKMSSHRLLRIIATTYISVIRATPSIIMIFIVYYGLPFLTKGWFHINVEGWNRMYFVIIALTLLFSAPVSEIMRSAYKAVPTGQREAGLMVGMNQFQIFYRILLPQLFVIALPNFANSVINLLKEGALTFTIGVVDVVAKSQMIVANNSGGYAWQTYSALAIIYWVISVIIDKGVNSIEASFQKKRRAISA